MTAKKKTSRRKPKFLALPDSGPGMGEDFAAFAERMAAHGNHGALTAYQAARAVGVTHKDIQRDGLELVQSLEEALTETACMNDCTEQPATLHLVPDAVETTASVIESTSSEPAVTETPVVPVIEKEPAPSSKPKATHKLEALNYTLQSGSLTQLRRVKADNKVTQKILKDLSDGDYSVEQEIEASCKGRQKKELALVLHRFGQMHGQTFDTLDTAISFQPEPVLAATV